MRDRRNLHGMALVCSACLLGLLISNAAKAAVTQSFQQTGQLNVEFLANAGGNFQFTNGTFTLTQTNGPVVKAFLYAADFNSGGAPDLTLNSQAIAPVSVATDTEVNGTMLGYRWDVTNFIAPLSVNNYVIGQGIPGNQLTAVGLLVVYQTTSGPSRQVTIHDGIEQVGVNSGVMDTKNFIFSNITAGSTDVWTFTGYDSINNSNNPPTETGETVTWNGTNVGGPMDADIGFNTSLEKGTATSVTGNNTLSVKTGPAPVDNFGVIAAVSMVTIPEPSSALLLGGACLICVCRRGRGQ